jgi:hypothetical protein
MIRFPTRRSFTSVAALIALLAVAGVCPGAARAQGDAKATIAVLPFEVSPTLVDEPLETDVLVDAFSRVLVNTRKFTVVDRSRLERVRREQKFGASGLVDPARRASVGRLLGAQYLVVGTVRDFSAGPPQEMAYGSGFTRPVRISVEVQVVDSSTGAIVAAKQASATAQSRSSSPSAARGVPRDALEKASQEVAQESLVAILNGAFPIKIVALEDDGVRLNRGDDGGLEVGAVLRCFATGKKLVDPDTKESLGSSERALGSVRVTEVQGKTTVARYVESGSSMKVGDACRLDEDAADEAGTHRAPPPPGPIHAY